MHHLLEEFEEIGDEQIADVQAVHVGVGGKDDPATGISVAVGDYSVSGFDLRQSSINSAGETTAQPRRFSFGK